MLYNGPRIIEHLFHIIPKFFHKEARYDTHRKENRSHRQ